jgi:hypothetical protein
MAAAVDWPRTAVVKKKKENNIQDSSRARKVALLTPSWTFRLVDMEDFSK